MNSIAMSEKFEAIKKFVERDYLAADCLISIFNSAAKSFKVDSLLTPFPKPYLKDGKKNFDDLISHLDNFPSVEEFLLLVMGNNTSVIPNSSISLIHYIIENSKFSIKNVPKSNHTQILSLADSSGKISAKPNYIFEVNYPESSAENKFAEYAKIMNTKFAFHGTRFSNLYSILNFGLQQHLNKNGLFGEGLYLAQELDISLIFSPSVLSWDESKMGNTMSCVAICEYIDDPAYVKIRKENAKNSDIPHSYLLITNNEIVRVRYILLYGKKSNSSKKKISTALTSMENLDVSNLPIQQQRTRSSRFAKWCRENPFIVSLCLYMMLLLFVGLSNNRLVEYYKTHLMNFLKKQLKY